MNYIGYIYKITVNNPESSFNNCYYFGQHRYNNTINYYGSSTYLKQYKKKYKTFGLIKEIICECKDEEELNQKEKEIIGDLYLTDAFSNGGKCLNLRSGGDQSGFSKTSKRKMSISLKKFYKKNSLSWYNNGINTIYLKKNEEIPDGYKPGRIISNSIAKYNHLGKHWYNNGKIEKLCRKRPKNWVKGKLKNKLWYNNGIKEICTNVFPGLEWTQGRLRIGKLGRNQYSKKD